MGVSGKSKAGVSPVNCTHWKGVIHYGDELRCARPDCNAVLAVRTNERSKWTRPEAVSRTTKWRRETKQRAG
jgi:hypothetical protein